MDPIYYDSETAAFRGGMGEALGVPAAVLGAGYLGYGSAAAEHGYSIAQVIVATFAIWALPGQLILLEGVITGASAVAIVVAVSMSSARFLPMTMVLVPLIRDRRYGGWIFVIAQMVAMTSWAAAMRRCPDLSGPQRLPYFIGFGVVCITACVVCATAGYWLAGTFPPLLRLGFVFLAPVYFFVILIGDARTRLAAAALACGAVAGPLLYKITPQWSVLAAGFVGGTLAYYIQRAHGRR